MILEASPVSSVSAPSAFPASLSPLFDRSASSIPLIPQKTFVPSLTKEIAAISTSDGWSDELTAAVHLLNDDTKLAHDIVTDREDSEACNLVHAILHRREADYWNSKYWWSRISHPFLLHFYSPPSSSSSSSPSPSLSLARSEAKRFVDQIEDLAGGSRTGSSASSRGGPSAVSACGAKNLLAGVKAKQEEELKSLVRWLWEQGDQD